MAQAGDNEVLISVHGFKNSFDHAAVSLAELWHSCSAGIFSGQSTIRIGVPTPSDRDIENFLPMDR
jgi:hypothetical protein